MPRVEASDSVAEALAQLAASTASDAKATLIFERVKEEPKVLVPQHRAGSPMSLLALEGVNFGSSVDPRHPRPIIDNYI